MKNEVLEHSEDLVRYIEKVGTSLDNINSLSDEDVEIATTPKTAVFKTDKVILYKYGKLAGAKRRRRKPLLIAYSLIGSYRMLDLQPDRSVIRNLLLEGLDVYIIDWGSLNKSDRWLSFDDYIDSYLADCVDFITQEHDVADLSLMGVCEGGVFTASYASLNPEKVSSLILAVTPIDFHADITSNESLDKGYLNRLLRGFSRQQLENMVDAFGQLPGELYGLAFQEMTPVKSLTKYNFELLDSFSGSKDQVLNFLRMEKWLLERPHHPCEAAKQWLIDLYNENKLVKNEFRVNEQVVDLSNLTMPVLNIYAKHDHIVPPSTSEALSNYLPESAKYKSIELNAGHIGAFVSSKANAKVSSEITKWVGTISSKSALAA